MGARIRAMAAQACPRCRSEGGVDAQGNCLNCGAVMGLIQVQVQCPDLLRIGTNAVLLFEVESLTPQVLTGLALGLTNGPRFLTEESDVEATAGPLAAQGSRQLHLQIVPRVDGRVLLHLTLRFRDAERDDWLYTGTLDVRVAPASSASGGPVDVNVDGALVRGGITVHASGGQEVLAEPGDWAALPLSLKSRVRHEPRPIDVGVELDGRYRVERLLGRGAFGAVFRAVGISPDKEGQRFAIKTLRPELSDNPRQRRSFVREAQITGQLEHPNIVRLFDSGFFDGVPYLVMECLDGPTGDDLLAENDGGLPIDEVVAIGRALCGALQYAHERKVFHRDVKPSNLILAGDGTPKLTDFNLARVVKTQMSHLSAKENSGTAVYMSKEQILSPQRPTPQQDLWSLGVTLYELLCGEPPFQGDTGLVLQQIMYADLPPLGGEVPPWLEAAVLRCLARDPAERWPSAADLGDALADRGRSASDAAKEKHKAEEARIAEEREAAERKARESAARKLREMRERIGMVPIRPGTFQMGSPEDEEGRRDGEILHEVRITRPFELGRTPVTQGLWMSVMGDNPSRFEGDHRPVETVSWLDTVRFCNALSEREGLRPAYRIDGQEVSWDRSADGFRLPTEAEWEYAARAGERHLYAGSDDLDAVAWWGQNSGKETHPVGQKQSNAWGLHDLSGNVWEWCWDWFDGYPTEPVVDPVGPDTGSLRVFRGGSWWNGDPHILRAAARLRSVPSGRGGFVGFRLARDVP